MKEAHRLVSASLAPAPPERIVGALAVMCALVARRMEDAADTELLLKAYTDRLLAWPGDVALSVLNDWPSRSQWWPTWFELEQLLEKRAAWRRSLLASIEQMMRWEEQPQIEAPPRPPPEPEWTDEERTAAAARLREVVQTLKSNGSAEPDGQVISMADRVKARAKNKGAA